MDQCKRRLQLSQEPPLRSDNSHPHQHQHQLRETTEVEVRDASAARKVQKADREKLRRDRLNEQFVELANVALLKTTQKSFGPQQLMVGAESESEPHSFPDRPKNDKASILNDTIQVLKGLTAEVNRLKADCAALSEESNELTLEKNELREEKASIKSDLDNLNLQYQQRLRVMFPWGAIDPSIVMPPPYSYPVALPVPSGPVPMHPFPFYGNQNTSANLNPSPTFVPYPNPPNPHISQPCTYAPAVCRSSKRESASKSTHRLKGCIEEKSDHSSDVMTELELKTPGSQTQESLPGDMKGKQAQGKEKNITDGSCSSSRNTYSQGFQDSSSNSVGNNGRLNIDDVFGAS